MEDLNLEKKNYRVVNYVIINKFSNNLVVGLYFIKKWFFIYFLFNKKEKLICLFRVRKPIWEKSTTVQGKESNENYLHEIKGMKTSQSHHSNEGEKGRNQDYYKLIY